MAYSRPHALRHCTLRRERTNARSEAWSAARRTARFGPPRHDATVLDHGLAPATAAEPHAACPSAACELRPGGDLAPALEQDGPAARPPCGRTPQASRTLPVPASTRRRMRRPHRGHPADSGRCLRARSAAPARRARLYRSVETARRPVLPDAAVQQSRLALLAALRSGKSGSEKSPNAPTALDVSTGQRVFVLPYPATQCLIMQTNSFVHDQLCEIFLKVTPPIRIIPAP